MRAFNSSSKNGMLLFFVIFLLCLQCSVNPIAGDKGNSSETTSGIAICATETILSGATVPGAKIYICDHDYIPPRKYGSADTLTADLDGLFNFTIQLPDTYNITVIIPDSTVGIFLPGIELGFSPIDTIRYDSLPPTATVSGEIPKIQITEYSLVFFEGTPFYSNGSSTGTIHIPDVPPGDYTAGIINDMVSLPGSTGPDFKKYDISILNDSTIVWK